MVVMVEEISVTQIIDQIMNRYGFRHQYQVAEYFGVSAQTLSGWVKNNIIPPKHLLRYWSEFQDQSNLDYVEIGERADPAGGFKTAAFIGQRISLAGIVYALVKNIKILFWVPAVICSYALIHLLFIAQPVFTATAKILPTGEKGGSFTGLAGAAAQFGINIPISMGENISWNELFPEIVRSQKLKRILLDRKFTTEKFGPDQSLHSIIVRKEGIKNEPYDVQWKVAIMVMENMIQVHKSRLSPLVTLEVAGFEPRFVADLAWATIEESSQMQLAIKTRQLTEKRKFIEERIAEVKQALAEAEVSLKDFREANRRMEKSPALQLEEERLSREVNLQSSLYVSLQGQYENTKIQEVEEGAMIQVIDDPIAPWTRTRPRRTRAMILTGIFSLGLALIIVYVREFVYVNQAQEKQTLSRAKMLLLKTLRGLVPFKSRK